MALSVQRQIRQARHPFILMSANGEVPESGRLDLRTEETPNVLSLGKPVGEEGYSFRWGHGKPPCLKPPEGDEFVLYVVDMVPYIDVGKIQSAYRKVRPVQHQR